MRLEYFRRDFKRLNGVQKFKGQAFEKAMSRARMSGKDYSDAVGEWLIKNQEKFGYKYSFTKFKKGKYNGRSWFQ